MVYPELACTETLECVEGGNLEEIMNGKLNKIIDSLAAVTPRA